MNDPPSPYVARHTCTLLLVTSAQAVLPGTYSQLCGSGCGRKWQVSWEMQAGARDMQPVWRCVAEPGQVAVADRTFVIRRATPRITAIAIDASVDVTAKWATAFPDAKYALEVVLPDALAANVRWSVKSQTPAAAVITLTATALVAAGSALDVTAYRYG